MAFPTEGGHRERDPHLLPEVPRARTPRFGAFDRRTDRRLEAHRARIDAGEPTHVPADTLGIQTDWPASSQRRVSMNPDESVVNKISGLDQLFLDSALAGQSLKSFGLTKDSL